MLQKKVMIVGGNPDTEKRSKIIDILHNAFLINKNDINSLELYNSRLPKDISGSNLIIWMPDISNEKPKDYPVKDKGAVLICSKVMRPGYGEFDAISRIFQMSGNAVIAIYTDNPKKAIFKLIDALGNTWCETADIQELYGAIIQFFEWTKTSIRKSLHNQPLDKLPLNITDIFNKNSEALKKFIEINNILASSVQTAVGKRFFGNLSTRCMKLFPSTRSNDYIFVSPRNVDKLKLTTEDFIIINLSDFSYFGERKPSVDTPIQCFLYNKYPEINFMIHGHAYLAGAPFTENYFPCGDMREAKEILSIWNDAPACINLKNHGFLITSKTLIEMEELINSAKVTSL